MNYQIIGNQLGRLDDRLLFNEAMRTAPGARNLIAHVYGEKEYRIDILYRDLKKDIGPLEEGCRKVLEVMNTEEITFSKNRRRGLFGY